MKRKEKLKQLSKFLTPDGAKKILLRLEDFFGTKKELAEKIGCSYPAVKKWTNGSVPGKKYLPEVLSLAFEHVPSSKKIVAREIFRMRDLGKELGVLKEFKSSTSKYLSELDRESVKIIRYVGKHRFAHINELENYLNGSSHSEILTRIEEVINERSENFFGEPAMEFRKSALDSQTGETVTFSWWLTRTGLEILNPGSKKDRLEVFEDGKKISFIYSSEMKNGFQPEASAEFNHGILTVRVSETNSEEVK